LLQILLTLSNKLQCIFYTVVWDHCEQRWCFSLLKTLRGRQYSLIQQTQITMQSKLQTPFTMQRKLLGNVPSNMKDFLRRSSVSTLTWKGLLITKLQFLTHENAER
jgi:hypothetical protein